MGARPSNRSIKKPERGPRAQHAAAYRALCVRLKEWRAEAGLTQRALAGRLGKPHSYVWKVEAAERRIDPVEFAAWVRACGVLPESAMGQLKL